MKNISVKRSMIFSLFVVAIAAWSFTTISGDGWTAPAEYQKMKNPVAADDNSIDAGKALYNLHCKSCHGKYGEGDGPKAATLDTHCGDFTSDAFQEQSDGSLFYKTKFGKEDMPSYEKKIPDDKDIWRLVNFMRTFGE